MKKTTLKKLALATGVAAAIAAPVSQASIIDHPFFRVLGVVIVWGGTSTTSTTPVVSDFVLMTPASGSAGADLIGGAAVDGRAVITGTLNGAPAVNTDGSIMSITNPLGTAPTFTDNGTTGFLDAADTLTAFTLQNSTDVDLSNSQVEHSFYVASNTAFEIQAVASNLNVTGDFSTGTALTLAAIGYELAVDAGTDTDGTITWGLNSQDPHSGGTGVVVGAAATLNDYTGSTAVFTGDRRTAASVGTIASQSVRFDATYTLGGTTGYDLSMGAGLIEADMTYTIFVP